MSWEVLSGEDLIRMGQSDLGRAMLRAVAPRVIMATGHGLVAGGDRSQVPPAGWGIRQGRSTRPVAWAAPGG